MAGGGTARSAAAAGRADRTALLRDRRVLHARRRRDVRLASLARRRLPDEPRVLAVACRIPGARTADGDPLRHPACLAFRHPPPPARAAPTPPPRPPPTPPPPPHS